MQKFKFDCWVDAIFGQSGGHNKKCLELGIGHGYTIEIFAKQFDEYIVLEGDRSVIKRFKKEFPNIEAKIIETYFEEWNTEERFDVIILGFVLEHVDNPQMIIRKYKHFLKSNGQIIITVPNAETLNRRIGVYAGILDDICQLSEHDMKAGHKRYYTLTSIREEIMDAGLEIICEEELFLKPITTAQMLALNLDKKVIKGYLEIGRNYPELCLGILSVCKHRDDI